jgi:WD40 repeat protein
MRSRHARGVSIVIAATIASGCVATALAQTRPGAPARPPSPTRQANLGGPTDLLVYGGGGISAVTQSGRATRLVRVPSGGSYRATAIEWAPDRSRVLWSGRPGVTVYDGSSPRPQPVVRGSIGMALSPNGKLIAYGGGGQPIFVANADGSGARRLVGPHQSPGYLGLDYSTLGWSADGSRVLYGTRRERPNCATCSQGVLMSVPVSGGPSKLLFAIPKEANVTPFAPHWSSKTNKIVFTVQGVGRAKIAVVNPDGTGYTELTAFTDGASHSPRWSPDGSRIAFVGNRRGDGAVRHVYFLSPTGKPLGRLPMQAILIDW